jgi:hypothetical protein
VRMQSDGSLGGTLSARTNFLEEWDFSRPDSEGNWTQIERKIVSHQASGLPITILPGTVIRYQRRGGGQWEHQFIAGGVTDKSMAAAHAAGMNMNPHYGFAKCWPPDDVDAGETWPIAVVDVPGMGTLPDVTGQATGKLISNTREGKTEWAVMEYSYELKWGKAGANRLVGRTQLKVNLSEGYITEWNQQWGETGTENSSTMRLVKR